MKILWVLVSVTDQRSLNGDATLGFRKCQGLLNRQHYKRLRNETTLWSWWVT